MPTVTGDVTPIADSETTDVGQVEVDEHSPKKTPHSRNESDDPDTDQQVLDEKATPQDGVQNGESLAPATVPSTGAGDQPSKADNNPFGLKPEYKTALKDFIVRTLLSAAMMDRVPC